MLSARVTCGDGRARMGATGGAWQGTGKPGYSAR